MAVKIRLSVVGKKNAPYFRVVAIDERRKRDGAALEVLGTYNPHKGALIQWHQDRIDAWVAKGAIVTDAVKKLAKLNRDKAVA